MNGYLLVDKPAGISSFGVVAKVRRILSERAGSKIKVGHTGTLDPMATGLLILVVGAYTKKAGDFSKLDKVYEAELILGSNSSTADAEGEITKQNSDQPTADKIRIVLEEFVGEIQQTPPAFSAVKVGGQRAYKLARAGKEFKIEPRTVKIYSISRMTYNYPKLSFTAHVGSGTYIRSLAQDIGMKLGTGAYLSRLRRVSVGAHKVKDSVELGQADYELLLKNLKS